LSPQRPDAVLVAEALRGRREAFRIIVERYQTLLCSVAYNATGSLNRSEDLAQEAFVTAWSRLGSLREPAKLRSWLCGIVRNVIQRNRRDERREPVHAAEPLEALEHACAPGALPSDQAVARDEEALLWHTLEKIPPLYREPLILFYREQQSVEQVAAALDLSADTAKQRLSRGRKLLQDEVQALVENTLRRSAPNRAFSVAVVSMLPMAMGPVATAGLVTKGSAKSGLLAGLLMPLAPFLGIAAGVVAQWLVVRDLTTDSRRRRKWIIGIVVAWIGFVALAAMGEATVRSAVSAWTPGSRLAGIICYWWLFVAGTLAAQFVALRRIKRERPAPQAILRMRPVTVITLAIGLHLALFGSLVMLAWRWADPLGVGLIAGALVVLSAVSAWRLGQHRGDGAAILRDLGGHSAIAGGTILLILAWRADAWIANAHGLTVDAAHQALPTWLVPALALALVLWTGVLLIWARPGRDDGYAVASPPALD
jgi:RNA polymerase sigma factor (sigma-70 family)